MVMVTRRPSNSIRRYIPKKSENMCPHEHLYMNNHSHITHNRQKSGNNPNIHQLKDREMKYGLYPYDATLFASQ